MARRARDRVAIDLCGIADAVRAAAQARDATLAVFARQALIAALPAGAARLLPHIEAHDDAGSTVKLSVRLSHDDTAILATRAALLGLSQARLVALLVRGAELPQPARERAADRAALRASIEQLAALSVDLQQFMRLLRRADSKGLVRYGQRIMSAPTRRNGQRGRGLCPLVCRSWPSQAGRRSGHTRARSIPGLSWAPSALS